VNDKEALIVLNMLPGVGSSRLKTLLECYESPAEVLKASAGSLEKINGIGASLASRIALWEQHTDLSGELDLAKRGGAKIITRLDENYPAPLREIYDPPICLYVRGQLPPAMNSIAIVGSRRLSDYGRETARHFAESAAYAGWPVISGLAYGIDAAAHRGCLDANGVTVAVLGTGLARIHPQDHIPMAREIIEKGALVSEFPMRYPANRQSFPRRNRIISGLSSAVLVIEAGLNSGALITAKAAIEQNRALFAIPGRIDRPQAKGCNMLIKESSAKLTETFEDILADFEFLPGFAPSPSFLKDKEKQPEQDFAGMTDDEKLIMEALSSGDNPPDIISSRTALPMGKTLSLLMKLEMSGKVIRKAGQIYSLHP
jgi:DNA processing protein